MSSNPLDGVIVPENMVRDFIYTHTAAVGEVHDIPNEFNTLGLDLMVRNRGAAAITVAINVGPLSGIFITVDPGDVYWLSHTKIWFVEVIAAVQFDIQITGVRITTLKRRGLM